LLSCNINAVLQVHQYTIYYEDDNSSFDIFYPLLKGDNKESKAIQIKRTQKFYVVLTEYNSSQ